MGKYGSVSGSGSVREDLPTSISSVQPSVGVEDRLHTNHASLGDKVALQTKSCQSGSYCEPVNHIRLEGSRIFWISTAFKVRHNPIFQVSWVRR